jgi:hypothetical protein
MYLASNAFQAGSLAASQPGLTIVDPLVASALGVVLFGERIDVHPWAVAGEVVAIAVIVTSVVVLARSPLVREERVDDRPAPARESTVEGPVPLSRPVTASTVGAAVAEGSGGGHRLRVRPRRHPGGRSGGGRVPGDGVGVLGPRPALTVARSRPSLGAGRSR